MPAGPEESPPPGWYADPADKALSRYWDGRAWTAGVARDGRVWEQPIDPAAARRVWSDQQDRRARWPASTVFVGVTGALAATGLAAAVQVGAEAVAGENDVVVFSASQVALWLGLLATCMLVSHRYATGRLREDYALGFRAADLGRGVGLSALGRLLSIVAIVPLVILLDLETVENLQEFDDVSEGVVGVAVVFLFLLVGAPLVEELFFRGLLQRSLEPRLGAAGAIAVQAVLFGLAHVSTRLGVANVVIFAGTFAGGVVLGAAAWHYQRLGPSVVAHSLFNLLPAILIALD